MAGRIPRCLTTFTRKILPLLRREANISSLINDVRNIVSTDRWNSFDRFHETTKTLVDAYRRNGAAAEVYQAPTGGMPGNGRWLIHEAADIRAATLDIVAPVKLRVLDYKQNPWHVVQWSDATPPEGIHCQLIAIDTPEDLHGVPEGSLSGKLILTRMNVWDHRRAFFEKGAAGVISDAPARGIPAGRLSRQSVQWTKFGWGGLSLQDNHARLVGLAISPAQGVKLRKLLARHPRVRVLVKADISHYAGTHDVVSGIVRGIGDPQSEVWAVAHSSEPGALDNASGVALCIEIAGLLQRLIAKQKLPPPRRSIRFLHGYECYGFFHYLEHHPRFQTPLAGVCIDTVGAKPELCGGKLRWHSTIPSSAGFVDDVGETIIRAAMRADNSGYRFLSRPFQSTEDTLLGDPKYGFPCPWITNHPFNGYHSSADTPALLHPRGLRTTAAAMAGYLYFLANAGTDEALELADWQTEKCVQRIGAAPKESEFLRARHTVNLQRLQRWLWGGDRKWILERFNQCSRRATNAAKIRSQRKKGGLIPQRIAPLAPTAENMKAEVAGRFERGITRWALYWVDGERTIGEIAKLLSVELNRAISEQDLEAYFKALTEIKYVDLISSAALITQARLVADLKKLGVKPGMKLMVHSALSKLGRVKGGANAVVDALLEALGENGTLLMPSFNHFNAQVYNPLTTPTTNGAIPDAMWRRPDAVRSRHPSHPVAAIGLNAEAWCRNHLENGIWARNSPIGNLVHHDGYILLLGVTNEASTAYHIAEISLNCGCLDQFGSRDRIVTEDGRVETVPGLAWRADNCPVSPRRLDESLDRRKLQVRGKVGNAEAILVKAHDVWTIRREHLQDICVTCTIKPERRSALSP